ncbi:flagellar export protein FliJ [Heliorestis acidaminivorans]|uniref:Flagellar FliJ protein n=1 Tax=Heliorestis acidaminivorans TaxID=553427 RepID=A0A6I0EUF2_9FIRM|nr:flagellar export protein FliJ [Heliorestis acidaminivorans]KAB2954395.1 flagellar export protein FliJ [Heliorestis acidaminivorans]
MKPFVFKLQRSLDLKLKEEEYLKTELQQQCEKVEECELYVKHNKEAMAEAIKKCKPQQGTAFDLDSRMIFSHFWQRLQEKEDELYEHLSSEREKEQEIREQLHKTMNERKILEKLRDKHLTAYQKEVLSEEQKVLDEMALNRFIASNNKGE